MTQRSTDCQRVSTVNGVQSSYDTVWLYIFGYGVLSKVEKKTWTLSDASDDHSCLTHPATDFTQLLMEQQRSRVKMEVKLGGV